MQMLHDGAHELQSNFLQIDAFTEEVCGTVGKRQDINITLPAHEGTLLVLEAP